jgi:hypothetical protein
MTMQQTRELQPIFKLLPVGGLVAVVIGLMMDIHQNTFVNDFVPTSNTSETCQGDIAQDVIVSREQLAAFLTISERDSKARVQNVLQSPYCYLSNLEVRAGIQSERAVYPLAFDPKTWLVVLYEGEEYVGYQFRFFNQE